MEFCNSDMKICMFIKQKAGKRMNLYPAFSFDRQNNWTYLEWT